MEPLAIANFILILNVYRVNFLENIFFLENFIPINIPWISTLSQSQNIVEIFF